MEAKGPNGGTPRHVSAAGRLLLLLSAEAFARRLRLDLLLFGGLGWSLGCGGRGRNAFRFLFLFELVELTKRGRMSKVNPVAGNGFSKPPLPAPPTACYV